MKFRFTRAQLRRESTHLVLLSRMVTARAYSAMAAHRTALILFASAGLLLLTLIAALIEASLVRPVCGPTVAARTVVAPTPAPAHVPPPIPPLPPVPPARKTRTVLVEAGDTLAELALCNGISFEQLAADNAITDPHWIHPGQRLIVNAMPPGLEVIAPGTTLTAYAFRFGIPVSTLRRLNPQLTDPDRIVAGAALRVRNP